MENKEKTFKTLSIKIAPPLSHNGAVSVARPGDVSLGLSDKEDLGHVQSFVVKASVGTFPTAEIITIMSNLEADVLQENTELVVSNSRKETYLFCLERIFLDMCDDYIKNKKSDLLPYIQEIYNNLARIFNNYGDLLYQFFDKRYEDCSFWNKKDILERLNIKISVKSILNDEIDKEKQKPKEMGLLSKMLKK